MITRNSLISETMKFTHEDRFKSWYYFLSTLVLSFLAFYGTNAAESIPLKLMCGLFAGLLTSRLFVMYHDFHHEAILRKSRAARFLMTLFGITTLAPASIWNETHQHHHNHNSKFSRFVVGSFPTLSADAFRNSSKAQQRWYLVLRHPLMILFAYIPIFLISFCLWPFFENPKRYYDCGLAAVLHLVFGGLLYVLGGWSAVVFSLIVPCLIMFAVGGYIFYAQHNFPTVILSDDDHWDYLEAALHSSSYIKMNRIMRWFTANIGYHHIHHVNARIPFYRLPEAMKCMVELQHPRSTSLHPVEIWKCLRLKLWDEKSGRMITMQEYQRAQAPVQFSLDSK
jgi:acyl-lipid omega-6 desaturase (Delta-12 desaturase)